MKSTGGWRGRGEAVRRAVSVGVAVLLGASAFTLTAAPVAANPGPSIDSSPTNATTATGLEWAFSNAIPASCELTDGATTVSPLADCMSPAEFNVSTDSGGSYTFTVYAASAANVVVGTTLSASSTVAVAPVAPTITSSPTSPDNDPTPTWRFTLPTGATASCEVDDPSSDPVETVAGCTSPFTAANLGAAPANGANGAYTFSVTPTAGGVTGAAATSTYSFDTAKPAAPVVTADAATGFGRHPTFSVAGLVAGATLSCSVTGPGAGPAVTVASCGTASALDLTGGNDGTYTLHVTQTHAGNVSDDGTASYLLDTHTPATPSVTAPASPGADESPTFAISGIEAGGSAVCSVTGPSTLPAPSCGSTSTLDLSSAGNGTYTLRVVVRDAAGKDSAPATATYEFEAAGPSTPVVTGPTSPGNSRVPAFTVTDADPVDLTYDCTVTGPSTVTTSLCGPTTDLNLASAADGVYHLSVVAIDGLNQTSAAGKATYTLDTTPPPAPTVTAPSSPSSDTSPTFAISEAEPGTTLTCTIDGPISFPIPPAECAAGVIDISGSNHDGVYTLSVTATDAAGNVSPAGSATYTLDTTPPPPPTVVAPPSPSDDVTPTFAIADAEAGATLSCVLTDPGANVLFTGVCPTSGTFNTGGDSTDGTYHLVVTATDAAGNHASTSTPWTRDTVPPPVPTVVAPASPSNQLTPVFAISDSEPGVSFGCVLFGPGGGGLFLGPCPADGSFAVGALGDGTYLLEVTATDAAGNASAPGTADYVLDTSPPPAPSVALVPPLLSLGKVTSPQFSVSDSQPGVSYTCSVSGATTVPSSAITCGATTTVNLSGPGRDGSYTLSVVAVDPAGNDSSAGTATYDLDTTAPPAPTVAAPPSPSQDLTPTFTITDSESDVIFDCTLTGPGATTVFANICPANGTFDLTGFGDGTYLLSVTATDPAGNVDLGTSTATYVLDTTPPPVPSVTLTSPLVSPGNVTTPQFAVSDGETGVSYTCSVSGPTAVPASAITCGAATTVDLTGPGRDGTYKLSVTATDAAGNTSAAKVATYRLDTTPPPAPTVTLSVPASSPGNVTAPQFAVTDLSPATFSCTVTGATPVPASAITCGATVTVDLSGANRDGSYTLSVTATDPAGNTGPASTATYTLDTVAPPVPTVTLSVPASSPGKVTAPQFSVTDTESGVSYSCTVSGATTVPSARIACGATTTVDLSPAGSDGSYTLSVVAIDAAGNASAAGTADYTLDTTPPPPPAVTLSSPASSPSNAANPSFAVSDSESGVTYTCTVSGPTVVPASAIACGATTAVDLSGPGRDGTYKLSVTATDVAGNTSAATTAKYVLDTTAPPVPSVALSNPGSSPGNVTAPQFLVSDTEPAVTYACVVTGATTVPSSAVTCGSTTTVDLSGAGRDGSYTLSVTASDAAGNTSLAGTATYTLDTAPPPAPVVVPPGPSNRMPVFAITDGDPSATLTCSLTSPKAKTVFPLSPPATCPANGTFDTTGFGDGVYTLVVTATDPAGNATSTTVAWLRDTTPPAVPTVTLSVPSASPGNVTAPQFSVADTEVGVVFACTVTGATTVPASAITCGDTTTVDLSGTGRDGVYVLSVTATDSAGNTSTAGTATYQLDTTPPPVPTVTLSTPATSPGNVTSPQFSVSDTEAGVGFTCTVSGVTAVPGTAVTCGATTTVNLSGAGRDGSYTLSVTATDEAGNVSTSAGIATYLLDTTAPPIPSVVLSVPASSPGNVTAPRFAVSDTEAGVTFSCTMSGVTAVPTTAIGCGATTTVDLSGVGRDGDYTLSVTATDAAGNVSSAGVATYTLDTTPPAPPVVGLASAIRSNSKTPLWTWQYGFNDQATASDVATCTLTGPSPWTSTTVNCPHHFVAPLGGGDGQYRLTVTLTDEAGNSASATSPVYTLDSQAPPGPTVFLINPRNGTAGLTRHPVWSVTGPPGTTLMCTLRRGGHHGAVVSPQAVCPDPASYSLVGLQDGLFTLEVTATDTAGNQSFPAWSSYALVPSAPQVQPPATEDPTAVWSISGNPDDVWLCTLSLNNHVVSGPRRCGATPTYAMTSLPRGEYVLSVVQVGAQGVRSAPGSASWFWVGASSLPPPPPPPPPAGGHHHQQKPPTVSTPPFDSNPRSLLPPIIRKLQKLGHELSWVPLPLLHHDPVTNAVVSAVQGAVHAVGTAGGGTGFPLLLIGLVLAFLLVQNRIDRRDPKLALASIAADDTVEFQPPPSRRDEP